MIPRRLPKQETTELPPVTYNTARRARYHTDEDYKAKTQKAGRETYRKRVGMTDNNHLPKLANYPTLALTRRVLLPSGRIRYWPTINYTGVGKALGRDYPTIWRWIQLGILPPPVLRSLHTGHRFYHLLEVEILVQEVSHHDKAYFYLRRDHTRCCALIQHRIQELRTKLEF